MRKLLRREPEIDFQSATQAGLARLNDPEVLTLAARRGRILVRHDEATMPRHFAELISNQHSAGLLIVGQALPHSVVVQELHLIWAASEAEEWVDRISCYLPRYPAQKGEAHCNDCQQIGEATSNHSTALIWRTRWRGHAPTLYAAGL